MTDYLQKTSDWLLRLRKKHPRNEKMCILRVEPKVTFDKYLGYSKNSSGRSEPNSLYVIRVLVNKKS